MDTEQTPAASCSQFYEAEESRTEALVEIAVVPVAVEDQPSSQATRPAGGYLHANAWQ